MIRQRITASSRAPQWRDSDRQAFSPSMIVPHSPLCLVLLLASGPVMAQPFAPPPPDRGPPPGPAPWYGPSTGPPPPGSAMRVMSDTPEFCAHLARQFAREKAARMVVPRGSVILAAEGEHMCTQGLVRAGIARLRKALFLMGGD